MLAAHNTAARRPPGKSASRCALRLVLLRGRHTLAARGEVSPAQLGGGLVLASIRLVFFVTLSGRDRHHFGQRCRYGSYMPSGEHGWRAAVLTEEQVRAGLSARISYASKQGRPHLEVNAGELERRLGASGMVPLVCAAMWSEFRHGRAEIMLRPESGQSAELTIRYYLPRQGAE
jgi:hypothetical protein